MPTPRRPIRVLVVDDDETFVALAREWLAAEPSLEFVGWAPDGQEALEAVSRLSPAVVLVGSVLPGLAGLDTARRIKALPDAPLVVVTSFADEESVRLEAWMAGADAFVAKTELTEQLPALLAGSAGDERPLRSRPPRLRVGPPEDEAGH